MTRVVCPHCGGVVTGTRRVLLDDSVANHLASCPAVRIVAERRRT